MRQVLARLGTAVTFIVSAVTLSILALVMWLAWELQPWIPAGRVFALGHWHFGDCEFEAWQRKNNSVTEPFADGLFVRQGTNRWEAFCFDIQDSYRPRIKLVQESGQIVVYRDRENRGVYDLATHTFRRHGQVFEPVVLSSGTNPPADWWLKP